MKFYFILMMIFKKIINILFIFGIECFPSYSVDVLEINTHYDKDGNPSWRQLIAWKRFEDGKLHNVGWRFIHKLSDFPTKIGNHWNITIYGETKPIHVIAPTIKNSYTQCDPERDDTNLYWRGEAPNIFVNKYNKVTVEYE